MTPSADPSTGPLADPAENTARVPVYDQVTVGDELPPVEVWVRRGDLVRYAGASGDFNPIHWNSRAATELGLPDVIAHGMFTMGQAARVLTGWVVDPGRIVEFTVRFANPVVVPDQLDGVTVSYAGKVAEKLNDNRVRIELTASCGESKVLGNARAIVRL